MKLIIVEKPSVVQSVAKVIGATTRRDGYIEGNGYIVSWCVGHLVSLANAEDYDEKYKTWSIENLPIIPTKFKYKVADGKKKQLDLLCKSNEENKNFST